MRVWSRLFPHVVSQSSPDVCFYVPQSRKGTITFGICWLVKVKETLHSFLMVLITIVALQLWLIAIVQINLGTTLNVILIY